MDQDRLQACLAHLDTAERLLEEAGELAALARLSLAVDLLRRSHRLPERLIPLDLWPCPGPLPDRGST